LDYFYIIRFHSHVPYHINSSTTPYDPVPYPVRLGIKRVSLLRCCIGFFQLSAARFIKLERFETRFIILPSSFDNLRYWLDAGVGVQ
jgi:hypothetical protein